MKGKMGKSSPRGFDVAIVDGMNTVHRHYWMLKELKDSKGRPTGMLYGVLNYTLGLVKKYGCEVAFAWDTKSEWRLALDPEYKGKRNKERPEGFWTEVKELQLLLSFMGVRQCYADGFEADDVAAALVKQYEGKNVLLVSGDGDWLQMLGEKVSIQVKNEVHTVVDAEAIHGIHVEWYPLYKAIVGDKSDNIRGVQRLDKDAVKSICMKSKRGGNFKDTYWIKWPQVDTLSEVEKKTLAKIRESSDSVLRNLRLVTLVSEGYDIKEISPERDIGRLIKKLKDYDMKALAERFEHER